jgi:hypothetical protein
LQLEAASYMPTYKALQRMVERVRQWARLPYPAPTSIADIVIPDELRLTARHKVFLLCDSGPGDCDRMLVFGTQDNLTILESHRHWYVDGTFKVAPTLFYQLFTIHALIDKSALPMVYALLQNKTKQSYKRLFQFMLTTKPNLAPLTVTMDYEKACQNAIMCVFPESNIAGCLFHLGQCLWRKVQQLGLVVSYREDESVRLHVKMLIALAFVPVVDVYFAWEIL